MNLISCNHCGVVLDKDKLPFANEKHMYTDEGEVNTDKFEWDGEEYVAKARCPVCYEDILEEK